MIIKGKMKEEDVWVCLFTWHLLGKIFLFVYVLVCMALLFSGDFSFIIFCDFFAA